MIRFTIKGEPASKANSREWVIPKAKAGEPPRKPIMKKSDKAIEYERSATMQIPHTAKQMLTGPLRMTIYIFYATERPDLDESVVLDVLQAKYTSAKEAKKNGKPRELIRRGVYLNDRQVRERHVYHGIDSKNPRAEIEIEPLQPQQTGLTGFDTEERPATKARTKTPAAPAESLATLEDGKDPF